MGGPGEDRFALTCEARPDRKASHERVPKALLFQPGLLSASQKMAELREHHRCLNVALGEFKAELLEQARLVLQADALTRSEKFIGVVEWLIARQRERTLPHGRNLIAGMDAEMKRHGAALRLTVL